MPTEPWRIIEAFVARAGVEKELEAASVPPQKDSHYKAKVRQFYAKHADDKTPLYRYRVGFTIYLVFIILTIYYSGFFDLLERVERYANGRKQP